MGRSVGQDERGCIVERESGRQRHHEAGIDDRVRAEAAGAAEGGDVIADLQVPDAFADRLDDAGVLGARDEGQWRLHLVLVLHDQDVGEVQARGLDRDAHFAGLRLGRGQFLPDQGIDADGVLAQPGMHGSLLVFGSPRTRRCGA